jgi:type II secretory pathway predicted ATPase ExeA
MTRSFNTAGPCQSDIHYMLSPLVRLPQLQQFIAQRNYFVIHAPRQIGKTTAIMGLAQQLTASGQYAAIVLSAEVGAPFSQDITIAEEAILGAWQDTIAIRLPIELQPPPWTSTRPGQRIRAALQAWAQSCPKPLVIFIDEIDSLQDIALVSILRQLRDGYSNRPDAFPQSIGLIGMRDVRDYKVAAGGSDRLQTASPFNIKVESLTMRNFYESEVAELYQQHTDDTGQLFTNEAVQLVFELTQGQPWLVNAIAR